MDQKQINKIQKVFSNTYWYNQSDWEYKDELVTLKKTILSKRVKFAIENKITKYCRLPEYYKKKHIFYDFFDHEELYKTENGYIFLTSPYGQHDASAQWLEFIKQPCLYHYFTSSYSKTFKSKHELNAFIKFISEVNK